MPIQDNLQLLIKPVSAEPIRKLAAQWRQDAAVSKTAPDPTQSRTYD